MSIWATEYLCVLSRYSKFTVIRNLYMVLEKMMKLGTEAIIKNNYEINVPVLLSRVYKRTRDMFRAKGPD